MTVTSYEQYLNNKGVPYHDMMKHGGRCRRDVKNYGSWLRKNHPVMFILNWKEHNRLRGRVINV